ncbi:MAG: hypothetical protein KDA97_08435 [Acidimicrobiales bacterium]|nr:hypothetical protein [Acidimicrobiales bacterium]
MSIGIRRPWEAADIAAVVAAFPPAPEYFESRWLEDREAIEARQLARLRERALAAARVPFFADRFAAAGFEPRALRSLDDLSSAPTYDVEDLRASIEAHPPWGTYQAFDPVEACREPQRVFMSGGTTGRARPTLYTAWDREVGSLLSARALYLQGIRPGDVVLNTWSYGLHNGAHMFDDALYRWLNCLVLTTSAGNVTSSEKQVRLALEYGASAILGTGDYLLRLAEVAREMGIDPRRDLALKALPNIGDRALLEETFGAECFESYGIHEVQWIAVECPAHDGLHVFEDAFVVQVVDPDTGEELPDGEQGSLVVTELYKTGNPQFRYSTLDLSYRYPVGRCECGSWLRRIGRFSGRADNMVKLRGINVWPEALGELALAVDGVADDYFVRAVRRNERDDLVVHVTSDRPVEEHEAVGVEVAGALQRAVGVVIAVEVVPRGELDHWTEIATSPKPKRFRDER